MVICVLWLIMEWIGDWSGLFFIAGGAGGYRGDRGSIGWMGCIGSRGKWSWLSDIYCAFSVRVGGCLWQGIWQSGVQLG